MIRTRTHQFTFAPSYIGELYDLVLLVSPYLIHSTVILKESPSWAKRRLFQSDISKMAWLLRTLNSNDLVKDPYQLHNHDSDPDYAEVCKDLIARMERQMTALVNAQLGWWF